MTHSTSTTSTSLAKPPSHTHKSQSRNHRQQLYLHSDALWDMPVTTAHTAIRSPSPTVTPPAEGIIPHPLNLIDVAHVKKARPRKNKVTQEADSSPRKATERGTMTGGPQSLKNQNGDAMTWQQESLSGLAIHSPPHLMPSSNGNGNVSGNGRRGGNGSNGITKKANTTPVIPSSSDSGLNWQEALTQQSSPSKSFAPFSPPSSSNNNNNNTNGNTNGRRQQQQQLLDESTFGVSNDVFSSPSPLLQNARTASSSQRASPRLPSARNHSPAIQHSPSQHNQFATPPRPSSTSNLSFTSHSTNNNATPVAVVEARYAGPTFHNSPAPSSLGIPNFLAKKRAAAKMAEEAGEVSMMV